MRIFSKHIECSLSFGFNSEFIASMNSDDLYNIKRSFNGNSLVSLFPRSDLGIDAFSIRSFMSANFSGINCSR